MKFSYSLKLGYFSYNYLPMFCQKATKTLIYFAQYFLRYDLRLC